jgi:hypothetical protein
LSASGSEMDVKIDAEAFFKHSDTQDGVTSADHSRMFTIKGGNCIKILKKHFR